MAYETTIALRNLFAVNDEPLFRFLITVCNIATFEPAIPVKGGLVSFRVKVSGEDCGAPDV